MEWRIHREKRILEEVIHLDNESSSLFEVMETETSFDELYYYENCIFMFRASGMYRNLTDEYYVLTKQLNGIKSVKMVSVKNSSEISGTQPFIELNGNNITAGFILRDHWYLFGGRFLCRMKVSSEEWNEFCLIEDISEWLGCEESSTSGTTGTITTETSESNNNTSVWIIIIIAMIAILLLVSIVTFLVLHFRSKASNKTVFLSISSNDTDSNASKVSKVSKS